MSPRATVPIQRPPSRSRSSLFESTSRSGSGLFGLIAPGIGYGATLPPANCMSPAPLMAINTRPSSPLLRSVTGSGIAYRLGGPGFHRQNPDSAPAQRLPEPSPYKPQTNEPKAPSCV